MSKNQKSLAPNISNKISQFKNQQQHPHQHHHHVETPIKTKTLLFVSKVNSAEQPNTKTENAPTFVDTCASNINSSASSSSSSCVLTDVNSSSTTKEPPYATKKSTSYLKQQQIQQSKSKLEYLQKQHRDSGFIDDKCMPESEYGKPPGPTIYPLSSSHEPNGYYLYDQQFSKAVVPNGFADDSGLEKEANTSYFETIDRLKPTLDLTKPLSIMKHKNQDKDGVTRKLG